MSLCWFGGFFSPWREMERLRREMNRLLASLPAEVGGAIAPGYPAMNVWTSDDGAIVTAELPGINIDDINISVVGDTLKLSGNREPDALPDDAGCDRRERRHGRFSRLFRLPFSIAPDEVEATFENGVLRVTLPRPESDRPKRIAVKTE